MRRLFPVLIALLRLPCHTPRLQATRIWSRCDHSARWGASFVIGIHRSFRFLVHPVERESRKQQNQLTEANARCAHKSSPSLSNLIIERLGMSMSNGRAPVRRIQIGFGPSGATTTAKWCQLGNTAHSISPNGVASPVHLFSFPHSGTVQVILPLSLIITAGSDSPQDDNPSSPGCKSGCVSKRV
jgi:hypothetical protein